MVDQGMRAERYEGNDKTPSGTTADDAERHSNRSAETVRRGR